MQPVIGWQARMYHLTWSNNNPDSINYYPHPYMWETESHWNLRRASNQSLGSLDLNPSLSESNVLVDQSCLTLCDPMDYSPPGSSVHGFFRQEYWSGLPCPSPGHLPDPGIKHRSPALQEDSLPSEPPGKAMETLMNKTDLKNPTFMTLILVTEDRQQTNK